MSKSRNKLTNPEVNITGATMTSIRSSKGHREVLDSGVGSNLTLCKEQYWKIVHSYGIVKDGSERKLKEWER